MPLSWNEIQDRALQFSKTWAGESAEHAEAKSFLDGFFSVFGVPRKRVATFEQRVKKLNGWDGYIDLLWKGILLVEQNLPSPSFIRTSACLALTMPITLVSTHRRLNVAVDAAYAKRKFTGDSDRGWRSCLNGISRSPARWNRKRRRARSG